LSTTDEKFDSFGAALSQRWAEVVDRLEHYHLYWLHGGRAPEDIPPREGDSALRRTAADKRRPAAITATITAILLAASTVTTAPVIDTWNPYRWLERWTGPITSTDHDLGPVLNFAAHSPVLAWLVFVTFYAAGFTAIRTVLAQARCGITAPFTRMRLGLIVGAASWMSYPVLLGVAPRWVAFIALGALFLAWRWFAVETAARAHAVLMLNKGAIIADIAAQRRRALVAITAHTSSVTD
jgi:hypothetical protein